VLVGGDQLSRCNRLLRDMNAVLQLAQLMQPEGGISRRGIDLARGVLLQNRTLQAQQQMDAAEHALAMLVPIFAPIRQAVAMVP
jgi:hypothetical protein